MGRILLVGRLRPRDLRRRPARPCCCCWSSTAATATLTLGLVLRGVTTQPYQGTRAATPGPDVVASLPGAAARPLTLLASPTSPRWPVRGVIGHTGPYPVALPVLRANGHAAVLAEGRDLSAGFGRPAETDRGPLVAGRRCGGGAELRRRARHPPR